MKPPTKWLAHPADNLRLGPPDRLSKEPGEEVAGESLLRISQHLFSRPLFEDLTGAQKAHTICHFTRERHLVGGHHDRHPGRFEFGDEEPLLVLTGWKPSEDLVAVRTDREPRRVPGRHPDLATQRHDRLPGHGTLHNAIFGDVMGESLVIAVTPRR